MATITQTRMTADDATTALATVVKRLETHRAICQQCHQCVTARGSIRTVWLACDSGRELYLTQLNLEHRLNYLKLKARRAQRALAAQQTKESE